MRKSIDEDFRNLKRREIRFVDSIGESNFTKTIIDGIPVEDINKVSKIIIASNPKVTINEICYQEKDNTLIFLANRKLDLQGYENYKSRLVSKKGPSGFKNYLYEAFINCEEIKSGEVSLKDIASLYSIKSKEFKERIDGYKEIISALLQIKGKYSFCNYVDFNYNSNILTLGIDRKHKYRFRINNGVVEYLDEDLSYLEEYILAIFNAYVDYQSYCRTDVLGLESSNTKFFINLDMLGFKTYLKDDSMVLFQIDYDAMSDYFSYRMYQTSFGRNKFVEDNYANFLKYIYVDISSLPIWLQQDILGIKNEELANKKGISVSIKQFLKRIRKLF